MPSVTEHTKTLNAGEVLDCLDLSTHTCRDFKVAQKDKFEEVTEEETQDDKDVDALLESLLKRLQDGAPALRALDLSFCDLGNTDHGAQESTMEANSKKKSLCQMDVQRAAADMDKARKENDFSKRQTKTKAATAVRTEAEGIIQTLDEENEAIMMDLEKTPWYRVIESWKTAKGCQLQLLSMKNCCLSVPAVRKLGEAILHFEHLTQQPSQSSDEAPVRPLRRLYLDGNNLGDDGGAVISEWLRQTKFLDELSLRNVGFTDEGVSAIVAALVSNTTLTKLDLRNNRAYNSAPAVSAIRGFNPKCEVLL